MGPGAASDQLKWNEIAPPDTNAILQISANDAKLFCTTVLGDTYQLDAGVLNMATIGNGWSLFSPTGNVRVGAEQIQNAAEVEGEVLAFTAGGVVHSANDGGEWIREKADEDKLRRIDEVAYSTTRYAITADTLLKKDGATGAWQRVQPSTGSCSSSSFSDNGTLRGDRLLKIDDGKLLLVYKLISTGSNVGCIFDTHSGNIEALTKGWQRSTAPATFVAIHGVLFAATQGGVERWLSSEHRWEDSAETSDSHSEMLPNNITAAAPYGSNGIIVATSSGNVYHSGFARGHLADWVSISDSAGQLMSNLAQNHSRIVAIWVNPERLSEIYLLLNQNGTAVFTRDKTDASFLFAYANQQDLPIGFVRTSDGTLLTFGTNQVSRVNSNRPLAGSFGDYGQRFGDKIQTWLKEPISWVTAFVGAYFIAVLCILALRYLPPNPILGRNWLASFVVKPLTMIPLSGRWILFLGYRRRVSRVLKRDTPYFGLPMDLPS